MAKKKPKKKPAEDPSLIRQYHGIVLHSWGHHKHIVAAEPATEYDSLGDAILRCRELSAERPTLINDDQKAVED